MRPSPGQILAQLYAIKPETIARDLTHAEGRLPAIVATISKLQEISSDRRTADDGAQIAHLMMVQAHELCRAPNVLPEFKVFYASFGVGHIVQLAETVAMDQGRLAELSREMKEIRLREGLSADEYWLRQRGPADHQALEAESEKIGEEIVDTVIISVLNRYRLSHQAKLYEHDRRQWEFLREIGNRVVAGEEEGGRDAAKYTDAYFAKHYGKAFVEEIHGRVSVLRQLVKRARSRSI